VKRPYTNGNKKKTTSNFKFNSLMSDQLGYALWYTKKISLKNGFFPPKISKIFKFTLQFFLKSSFSEIKFLKKIQKKKTTLTPTQFMF